MTEALDSTIIVALDYATPVEALAFVDKIDSGLCKLKVGNELFTAAGPQFVKKLVEKDFSVFLDLKFHDIPATVARAVAVASDMGVWMTNIHTCGGRRMMDAASHQLAQDNSDMLLIGVTVLTSMEAVDLMDIGIVTEPGDQVMRLARLAKDSGLHGVVCSALEADAIRNDLGQNFLRVTPGIRPAAAENEDQRRVMTPAAALAAGSSYLVIGRPVTRAPDPKAALLAIRREIGED